MAIMSFILLLRKKIFKIIHKALTAHVFTKELLWMNQVNNTFCLLTWIFLIILCLFSQYVLNLIDCCYLFIHFSRICYKQIISEVIQWIGIFNQNSHFQYLTIISVCICYTITGGNVFFAKAKITCYAISLISIVARFII